MIVDEINELLLDLNMPLIRNLKITGELNVDNGHKHITVTPAHDLLDKIDKHFGIITRFKLGGSLAPVGERVRRLKRRKALSECPMYFLLGADAETFQDPNDIYLALTG